jgi:type II secretory pathway pseudopilin PulG
MENASKALIIAGSILLAIIILSLIVYVATSTSRMVQAQEEKKATEEIATFNKQYEAYNKKRMYGTDVITVIKKAMEYNSKGGEQIKVELTIHTTYETVIQTITINDTGKVISTKEREKKGVSLEASEQPYSIDEVKNFFSQDPDDRLNEKDGEDKIINTYSALTSFKRSIFECNGVEYGKNGRINKMSFEEVKSFYEQQ